MWPLPECRDVIARRRPHKRHCPGIRAPAITQRERRFPATVPRWRHVRPLYTALRLARTPRIARPHRITGEPGAALQRGAGTAGCDRARRRRRAAPRHDALGPDSLVGEGARHRLPVDQCPLGNGADETVLPFGLAVAPLPDPGRRVLRVDGGEEGETALADHDEGGRRLLLRRPVGALESSGRSGS